MATFKFNLSENTNFYGVYAAGNSWCKINSIKLKQGVYEYTSSKTDGTFETDSTGFKKDEDIFAEVEFTLQEKPNGENLFRLEFSSSSSVYFGENDIKVFEVVGKDAGNKNIYSKIPYLKVNNVKYYIDYDFYYDEKTNTKFLKLIFDGYDGETAELFKLSGIGSFIITAKLCYVDSVGNIYWLNKSENIAVEVYEDLNDIIVYNYERVGFYARHGFW